MDSENKNNSSSKPESECESTYIPQTHYDRPIAQHRLEQVGPILDEIYAALQHIREQQGK